MREPNQKPRLLFLSHTLPFPPDGGVNIRTYNVLRLLSREFSVTALCFHRRSTHPSEARLRASVEALGEFADVRAFPIPQEYSRGRLIRDHLRSVVRRRPYTVPAYDSTPFRSTLRQLLADHSFDLIHVDSLDLAGYLPLLDGVPVVCVHHNVESELLRRRARNERNPVLRQYFGLQSRFLRSEEERWTPRVALNVMVSQQDREMLDRIVPANRSTVVPNGVDTQQFHPAHDGSDGVVFVGGYDWYPNRDALEYFATEILPHMSRRNPRVRISWIGRAPDAVRKHYLEEHGIELTGYVDDIRPIVDNAACYVVPLRVGGGTRLKILDAWALGKAVVSTSVGCEGLRAIDGDNILIRDDPRAFAAAIEDVIRDEAIRRALGQSGRRLVEQYYDWELIGRDMIEHYRHATMDVAAEAGRPGS